MVNHFKHYSYIAVGAICRTVAGLTPNLAHVTYQKPGKDRDRFDHQLREWRYKKSLNSVKPHEDIDPVGHDHPLNRLLQKPNAVDMAFDLWYELLLFLELTGNGYLWCVPSTYGRLVGTGQPAELWVIPSHWVWPRVGKNRLIEYYELRPWAGGGTLKIPPEEVIHFRYKSPLHKVDGYSPQTAGAEWIDSAESIDRSRFWQFKNGCFPTGTIQLGESWKNQDPTDEDLERIYAKFFSRNQGEMNTGRPIITPPDAPYIPLSISPTEMAYTQSAEQMLAWVLSLWGVPKEIVGHQPVGSDLSWYASIRHFVHFTIAPKLLYLGQAITRHLCSRYDDRLRLWWDDPTPDSPTQRNADVQLRHATGSITPDEIRAIFGDKPLPEGGDKPIVSAPPPMPAPGGGGGAGTPPGQAAGTLLRSGEAVETVKHFEANGHAHANGHTTNGRLKESFFGNCPRDEHGHCKPSGQASDQAQEKPEQKPPVGSGAQHLEALHAKAEQMADDAIDQFTKDMAKIGNGRASRAIKGLVGLGTRFTKGVYDRLADRYGHPTAAACLAFGQVASWGAASAAAAAGSFIWVPSIVAAIPAVAIAEVYKQVRRGKKAVEGGGDIDLEVAEREGKELARGLARKLKQHLRENRRTLRPALRLANRGKKALVGVNGHTKGRGEPCHASERADETGCIPASGGQAADTAEEGGKKHPLSKRSQDDDDDDELSEDEVDYGRNGVKAAAFKAWFGDWENDPENASKAVTGAGKPSKNYPVRPTPVYHGTGSTFEAFDKDKIGSKTDDGYLGRGFYFTPNKYIADAYASNNADYVLMTCYLNVRNPLITSSDDFREFLKKEGKDKDAEQHDLNYKAIAEYLAPIFGGSEQLTAALKKHGYDGVLDQSRGIDEWMVPEPHQIKAVKNKGTFDPKDANIYKAEQSEEAVRKFFLSRRPLVEKGRGAACKPGERADETGCIPASGEGGENRRKKARAERGDMVPAERVVVPLKDSKGKPVLDSKGKPKMKGKIVLANGKDAPPHIQAIIGQIPATYTDIEVCLDPKAEVLATAILPAKADKPGSKDKKKTIYSKDWKVNSELAKFARVADLAEQEASILGEIEADRKTTWKDEADCIWMISQQATRPGGEDDTKGLEFLYKQPFTKDTIKVGKVTTPAGKPKKTKDGKQLYKVELAFKVGGKTHTVPIRNEKTAGKLLEVRKTGKGLEDARYWLQSFGATTLEGRHIVQASDGVHLQFMGKETIWHDHLVKDKNLAKMLLERKKKVGPKGKLFGIDAEELRDYTKRLGTGFTDEDGHSVGDFTPKDFRSLYATKMAAAEIKKIKKKPASEEEREKAIMDVCETVSGVLGNRAKQARESYIDPSVFMVWDLPKKKGGAVKKALSTPAGWGSLGGDEETPASSGSGSYGHDCPRDSEGHCKPRNSGDETGQGGEQEQQGRQPAKARTLQEHHLSAVKKVGAPLKAAIESGALTPEQGRAYAGAIGRAVMHMTPEATKLIEKNLTGQTRFYSDLKGLTEGIVDRLKERNKGNLDKVQPTIDKLSAPKYRVGGCYMTGKDGHELHLDGGTAGSGIKLKDMDLAHQIYAHELTHAIDGPFHEASKSKEWQEAFDAEIKGWKLTAYADTSHSEAFAEFGRSVYSGDFDHAQLKAKYPKCWAVFESRKLVDPVGDKPVEKELSTPAKEEEKAEPLMPDIFAGSVDLGDEGHADLLQGEEEK